MHVKNKLKGISSLLQREGSGDDWHPPVPWPLFSVLAALIIATAYALAPFDPPTTGLYFQMTETIVDHGFGLPERIPYYAPGGLPFGYPPLSFYVLGAAHALFGGSIATIAVWLAGVYHVAWALSMYYLAREILDSPPAAALAATLLAVTPGAFFPHLGTYGAVRGLAYAATIAGLASGVRLFKTERVVYVPIAGVLFGVTLLTHLTYVPFFVLSFLLLYAEYSRSLVGFLLGAGVALGGFIVATPWLGAVIATHGVDLFTSAAGTHGGVGTAITNPPFEAALNLHADGDYRFMPLRVWWLVPVGIVYLLARQRFLLPAWFVAIVFLFYRPRFIAVPIVLITTAFLIGGLLPLLRQQSPTPGWGKTMGVVMIIGMVAFAGAAGADYAVEEPPKQLHDDYYDAADWLRTQTPADATFVSQVAAERMPYLAQRTIVILTPGSEWAGPGAWSGNEALQRRLDACRTPTCMTEVLQKTDHRVDYVVARKTRIATQAFATSDRYTKTYENGRTVIYKVGVTTDTGE